MDMNQLLYNHQLALLQASNAPSGAQRANLEALVDHHAGRINTWLRTNHLPVAGWPSDKRLAGGIADTRGHE